MRIISVKHKTNITPVTTIDTIVGNGYLQGAGGSLADVDTDYQSDRRSEVKEYLERRYNVNGKQRVFSAGTMTTLKIKATLKDVARVHKVPLNITNYISAIFEDDKMSWGDLFLLASKTPKVRKFIHDYPQVIEDMRGVMGGPRSASVHASAILITPDTKDGESMECFDYTPIKKVDDILVSEFDGYSLDEVGLLKNDCLGIKELSKIKQTIEEVNRIYGANLSFEEIVTGSLDDAKTFEVLSDGNTQNVFQFSSKGMTKFLMDMRPNNINDLIAAAALYRPAPIEAGSTQRYIDCKRGDVEPTYLWGTEKALKDTLSILTFQEQISQLVYDIGGFSLGEGVKLLKLISKKRIDIIAAMKDKFMTGASSKGCPTEDAEQIWHLIELSGSYLLNKSHATAYAVTAYVGAFLKANYPTAFYSVALQWADDKELTNLMSEMEECSIANIVPPDVNVSQEKFFTDYDNDEIFWSLTRIKMLGAKAVDYIISKRGDGYKSLEDFITRLFVNKEGRSPLNTRHLKNMILVGCFDKVEGVSCITERYDILCRAAEMLNFELPEPNDKPYHYQMQQIALSGIGSVNYEAIFDSSEAKPRFKGKAKYMPLSQALDMDSEGKKIAVCATVTEVEERSYMDKQTGEKRRFYKVVLQQNNDLMELILWNDFVMAYNDNLLELKDKVIVASAMVKYSDFAGANSLNSYKSTILTII
ncbi:MAG: DNA polymerase III subunit alpha [Rikenellaceae bacterium]